MNSLGTPPREFTASDRVPRARRPLPEASTLTGEVRRLYGFDVTGVDYDPPAETETETETATPWPNSAT